MEQQKLMDELNYHRAQKLTDALYHSGLISFEEYDKLTLKNRNSFSPIYVDLLPKTLADCPKTKKSLEKLCEK